jgi:hypothetical protein
MSIDDKLSRAASALDALERSIEETARSQELEHPDECYALGILSGVAYVTLNGSFTAANLRALADAMERAEP